jgi:transposase InsO family protein
VLDPLEPALHERRPFAGRGLVCHSDRGSHYVSVRYTERLTEAAIELSVGSVGNSYDNALAATIIGLFRTEVIHRRSPWRSLKAVEFATFEWVDWFNTRRRHLGGCLGIPDSATVPPPPDLVRHAATA